MGMKGLGGGRWRVAADNLALAALAACASASSRRNANRPPKPSANTANAKQHAYQAGFMLILHASVRAAPVSYAQRLRGRHHSAIAGTVNPLEQQRPWLARSAWCAHHHPR